MKRNKIIAKYVSRLPNGSSVLDIGCADMPEVSIAKPTLLHKVIVGAAAPGVKVVGFDKNKQRVNQLIETGYECLSGDILTPEIDELFDLIVAGEIIEHISDQAGFFESLSKLLKPGGCALISTPNPSGVMSVVGYWLIGEERGGDGHVLWQSPKTVRTLAITKGLVLEEIIHCNWDYPELWMYAAYPFELFPRLRPTLLFRLRKINQAA